MHIISIFCNIQCKIRKLHLILQCNDTCLINIHHVRLPAALIISANNLSWGNTNSHAASLTKIRKQNTWLPCNLGRSMRDVGQTEHEEWVRPPCLARLV